MFNFSNAFQQVPPFNGMYRVFSIACKKGELEGGDKILLPAGALDHLARLKVSYPMMFQIVNPQSGKKTHCGVMEFSAEEGVAYLPYWMMQNLFVENGGVVNISNLALPKGTYVKLQPHNTSFTDLSNPRVVLEKCLRNFSCLSQGDTICIGYGGENYYLDVVETKPGLAVGIIETDINVDFAEPKDFKQYEAKRKEEAATKAQEEKKKEEASAGVGGAAGAPPITPERPANDGGGYFAKLGAGNRLSGKKKSPSQADSSLASPAPASSSGTSEAGSRPGSARFNYQYKTEGTQKKLVRRVKTSSFKAFSGSGNSLK